MDVLDADNCEQIYQLVFVRPRALAHAAGAFLVKFLFNEERLAKRQKEEEEAGSQKSSPRKRGRGGQFHRSSNSPSLPVIGRTAM